MNKINLEEKKIYFEEKWLSAEDLKNKIQEKMHTGELRFANLAAALEELNSALENAHTIEVKLTLTTNEYEKLLEHGKADDKECIYKAIDAFIHKDAAPLSPSNAANSDQKKHKKRMAVKCANCGAPIQVSINQENEEITCSKCGARGLLKPLK